MNFEQKPKDDQLKGYIERIEKIRFMISNGFREILIDIAEFLL
jgi:hypothetical protein